VQCPRWFLPVDSTATFRLLSPSSKEVFPYPAHRLRLHSPIFCRPRNCTELNAPPGYTILSQWLSMQANGGVPPQTSLSGGFLVGWRWSFHDEQAFMGHFVTRLTEFIVKLLLPVPLLRPQKHRFSGAFSFDFPGDPWSPFFDGISFYGCMDFSIFLVLPPVPRGPSPLCVLYDSFFLQEPHLIVSPYPARPAGENLPPLSPFSTFFFCRLVDGLIRGKCSGGFSIPAARILLQSSSSPFCSMIASTPYPFPPLSVITAPYFPSYHSFAVPFSIEF